MFAKKECSDQVYKPFDIPTYHHEWKHDADQKITYYNIVPSDLAEFTKVALLSKLSCTRIRTASNPVCNVKSNWKYEKRHKISI